MKQVDSNDALLIDKDIISKKIFLKQIYVEFYKQLEPRNVPKGLIVELGSGGGFAKKYIHSLITSDVISTTNIDKVFAAEKIPFKNKSVSSYIMLDVLHHIKNPQRAFSEMERTLKPGGRIIMIEPWNSLWGKLIYKYLHHEHYEPMCKSWKIKGEGRMSDSNTALPWIIFVRDRKKFENKFPNLKIISIKPQMPFLYLFSGGLTKFQFAPLWAYKFIKRFENTLTPFNKWLGMFARIEIQKVIK